MNLITRMVKDRIAELEDVTAHDVCKVTYRIIQKTLQTNKDVLEALEKEDHPQSRRWSK